MVDGDRKSAAVVRYLLSPARKRLNQERLSAERTCGLTLFRRDSTAQTFVSTQARAFVTDGESCAGQRISARTDRTVLLPPPKSEDSPLPIGPVQTPTPPLAVFVMRLVT